jgi:hypothetical protein
VRGEDVKAQAGLDEKIAAAWRCGGEDEGHSAEYPAAKSCTKM